LNGIPISKGRIGLLRFRLGFPAEAAMGGGWLCGGLNSIQISKGELRLLGFALGFPSGDAMGGDSGVDLEK
jgi:hypothetical protein